MAFETISPEIIYSVNVLKRYLKRNGYVRLKDEVAPTFLPNARWRPTISAVTEDRNATFDIREDFKLEPRTFFDYFHDCQVERRNVEVWLVVALSSDDDFTYSHGFINYLKKNGMGLIVIRPNHLDVIVKAIPLNLRHHFSDEEIQAGRFTTPNRKVIEKFSDGHIEDALREITLTFERAIRLLGEQAVKNLRTHSKNYKKDPLEQCINSLGDHNKATPPPPILDRRMVNELIAFKDARNNAHHPFANRADELRFYRAAVERMMTGFRLIRELDEIRCNL